MNKLVNLKNKIQQKIFEAFNSDIARVIEKVRTENLSYLEIEALRELAEVVLTNEKRGIEGIIIEAGCALGGSAIVLANTKHASRELFVYDVFGMIPPPSERDDQDVHQRYELIKSGASEGLGDNTYYGYEENLYVKVSQAFERFELNLKENNIHLVKGLFQDTLQVDQPVSLAHIDCDWYDSVIICLSKIEPQLVSGGTLVIDDYDAWSGCRKAIDEYFDKKRNQYKFLYKKRLHIIKL